MKIAYTIAVIIVGILALFLYGHFETPNVGASETYSVCNQTLEKQDYKKMKKELIKTYKKNPEKLTLTDAYCLQDIINLEIKNGKHTFKDTSIESIINEIDKD